MKIKNLKINKNISKKTLMTICSLTLLSGCTKQVNKELSDLVINAIDPPDACTHLTVLFNNETITFKDCDGYHISTYYNNNYDLNYNIYLDGILIADGKTTFYNNSNVYHENIKELSSEKILIK